MFQVLSDEKNNIFIPFLSCNNSYVLCWMLLQWQSQVKIIEPEVRFRLDNQDRITWLVFRGWLFSRVSFSCLPFLFHLSSRLECGTSAELIDTTWPRQLHDQRRSERTFLLIPRFTLKHSETLSFPFSPYSQNSDSLSLLAA